MSDRIALEGHFRCYLKDPKTGKMVPDSLREGRNVVTTLGREFNAKRVCGAIATAHENGTLVEDALVEQNFLKWIGLGTGTQLEVPEVESMVAEASVDGTNNMKILALPPTFPEPGTVLFTTDFDKDELSYPDGPESVDVTEAALFLSSATPTLAGESVMAYKAIDRVTKTNGFILTVEWEWRY